MTDRLNLRGKLAAVYGKVDHIEKTGRNQKQNYDFVKAADVLHAIRKALIEFRVYAETNFDLLSTYDIKTNSGGNMHTATVKAFIVFHDLDSDEKITASGLGDGADGGDKGIYKAQTGAIKNALRNAFLVPDTTDPEADQSVDDAISEPARKVAQPAKVNEERLQKFVDDLFPDTGTAGPLPDESQLQVYTDRLRTLRNKLMDKSLGNERLKPSVGLGEPQKVKKYLQKTTGIEDFKKISTVQWDAFLQYAEKMDPVELVKLINGGSK